MADRKATFVPSKLYTQKESNWKSHLDSVASDIKDLVDSETSNTLATTVLSTAVELDKSIRNSIDGNDLEPLYKAVHKQLSVSSQHSVVVFDHEGIQGASGKAMNPGTASNILDGFPAVAVVEASSDDRATVGHEMLHNFGADHENKVLYEDLGWGGKATIMHGYHNLADCSGTIPGIEGWGQNFKISPEEDHGCTEHMSTKEAMDNFDVWLD